MSQGRKRNFFAVLGVVTLLTVGLAQATANQGLNRTFAPEVREIPVFLPTAVTPIPEVSPFLAASDANDAGLTSASLDFQAAGVTTVDESQRVPEPRGLALFGTGLLLLGFLLRTRPMAMVRAYARSSDSSSVPDVATASV